MISIRLGPLQLAGLTCHAPQDDLDTLEIVGDRLTVDDADRVAALVNDAGNSADDQHERERNRDDLRMARALANLARRVRRVA